MQIRHKITLYFLLFTGSVLLVSLIVIHRFSTIERNNLFRIRLREKALTSANLFFEFNNDSLLRRIDKEKVDIYEFENITIYNSSFEKLHQSNPDIKYEKYLPNVHAILKSITPLRELKLNVKGIEFLGLSLTKKKKNYVVLISAYDKDGKFFLSRLGRNLVYVFFIILSCLGVFARFFSKKILQPIQKIIGEVEHISTHNLTTRIEEKHSNDELDRLIKTFNQLIARIEQGFELQRKFTANVSHELKNPLASIISQLEVAIINAPDEQQHLLRSLLEDIHILNKITESMILMTKIGTQEKNIGFELQRIDEVLFKSIESYKKIRSDAQVKISVNQLPDNEEILYYNINSELMQRCFMNILDNAYKYSDNTEILVDFSHSNESFQIVFKNVYHYKLTTNNPEMLIKPFERGTAEKKYDGHGIGLNIVSQILSIHQFSQEVTIQDNTFRFTIYN